MIQQHDGLSRLNTNNVVMINFDSYKNPVFGRQKTYIASFLLSITRSNMHFTTAIIVALSLASVLVHAAPIDGLLDKVEDTLDHAVKRDLPDLIDRDASYCSE